MSGELRFGSFTELALVNSSVSIVGLRPETPVSFIPMADVSEPGHRIGQQTRELHEVERGYTSFQEGDILFAKITPCMENGKGAHALGLRNGVGFGSTEFHVLRAKPNSNPRAEAIMTGSAGQRRVGPDFFERFEVPLLPLHEQRRIAGILDTVDEAIRQTEKLIAKLKQIKAGLLHDLLTRGLDEEGRLRDPVAHPEQFKETVLGKLPAAWEIRQVGEIFDMQLGKMLSKAAKTGRSSFPYLANRNVQWDRVDLSDLPTMDFSDEEPAKYSLREGDLLVCEGGEIGRTAIWRGEMANCFYQKAIHRLRPKDERVLPRYMLRYMHKAVHESYFTKLTSQTSIAHLTQEKLELLSVPLPPIDEQQAIVEVFEAHDARIEAEAAYRDKLTRLKQGLLQDLLAGRVRTTDIALDEVVV